jgi:hypothetical protein
VLETMKLPKRLRSRETRERHLVNVAVNSFYVRVAMVQYVVLLTPKKRRRAEEICRVRNDGIHTPL